MSGSVKLRRIGVVVHPSRDVSEPFGVLREWCEMHDVEIVQIPVLGAQQEVAPTGHPTECDLIVAIGGDGTTLAAMHGAQECSVPVLGIAAGSLGALATVPAEDIASALERFGAGDWTLHELPALALDLEGERLLAFNDAAVVRGGEGQVRTRVSVDGTLYARLAGDGCVVSTAMGSSAYSFAAGGPLIAPGTDAFLVTPLSNHGGSCPPLVIPARARLRLDIEAAYSRVRFEVDGKALDASPKSLEAELAPGGARLVRFADQEPALAGLRRRGIIVDSPRILAEDARANAQLR